MRLEGKVAVITGAGSGIGRASALLFSEEGAAVVCADWHEGAAKETSDEVERRGGRATYVRTDVSDPADVQHMYEVAVSTFGGVDTIFNNAGIEGETAPTADCTLENWDRTIAVNLKGVFLGMKYGLPELLKRGGGSIVNNASVAGIVGFANIPAYCASKGGIVQLTKTTALEYAQQGVRVNVLCPGVIATPMVDRFSGGTEEGIEQMTAMEPIGRLGTADEVANMALYLASDDASFCTGGVYTVDGGFTAA
jgi:NAD(P)-dependent dehydrogenase (short-subunit alcohol dehydrogenase family)